MSELRGAVLYFDCYAGIAGDMTVAALVDLGVPEAVIRGALSSLALTGYRVAFERVLRGVMAGMKFRVETEVEGRESRVESYRGEVERLASSVERSGADIDHRVTDGDSHDHDHSHSHDHSHYYEHSHSHDHSHDHEHSHLHHGEHAHRHYSEIRAMIASSALSDGVKRRSLSIFDRIAVVEAKLHGTSVDEVAFHEVGAVDSIVDIVAAAAALDWLAPARVVSRVVPLGGGMVMTAHGRLPVPAPATLALLVGAKVEEGGIDAELTTPTGAAILADTVDEYGAFPSFTVAGVGWGAGDRELADRPNMLRVVAGHAATAAGDGARTLVIEANVDDLSPELIAPLIDEILAAGARDAWLQPVLMKKGRPGFLVGAIADPERRAAVEAALFRGSSTIGVRVHAVDRTMLDRRTVEVDTPWGRVPVKVAGRAGDDENAAPEFEACRALALAHGVPLKRVYAEALAAFFRR